ncbi:putative amidohydrolase [Deinobacterium chartae]|uniref:Putative amidohydrolase n=1 Tax=Deinobacterium chartae TaxID=521158 RepID=A0A841HZ11_9DEIO|nr:carbon-nitrogen hydrolase family protein [Deinobacterium chartae]MBB6097208.1 putative amidohydrolase [Deinobacterium chartae]
MQLHAPAYVRTPDLERNLELHLEALRGAQADLLIFPELALCPRPMGERADLDIHALHSQHPALEALRSACRSTKRALVTGTLWREAGALYNAALLILPDGTPQVYRKVHRVGMAPDRWLAGGDRLEVFPTPWGQLGLLVCYDLDFPEAARSLALAGADLIVLIAHWPLEGNLWEELVRVRALENHLYVVAVNGDPDNARDRARAAGPLGRLLAKEGADGSLSVELDLRAGRAPITERGGEITSDFLADRVPAAYRTERERVRGEGGPSPRTR